MFGLFRNKRYERQLESISVTLIKGCIDWKSDYEKLESKYKSEVEMYQKKIGELNTELVHLQGKYEELLKSKKRGK